ncbi:hypothetical protein VTL71DRAFT_21 [Oculimacula yallundae]|uniref:Heterokaryon incompatibility domain-containing protein n=1 Tax=Oculimacula yallundae TaxID=86028 RepID=A0ABR4D171_9HELO
MTTRPPEMLISVELDAPNRKNAWDDDLEIRLVHLQPRSVSGETIHCKLLSQVLVADSYEALSYEWGNISPELSINMDGVDVPVRENLWWALWHLRLENKPRILWIDALCINQNNTEERSYQVSRMDYIYYSASRCIAWVGKEEIGPGLGLDDCKLAMEFVARIYADRPLKTIPLTLSSGQREELDSLELLCRRRYWTRLWIIQEVLLSKDVLVQCGPYSVQWMALHYLFNNTKFYIHASYRFSITSSAAARIVRNWLPITDPVDRAPELAELVLQFRDSRCEDPRDTVFGLLGLAKICCRADIRADYSITPEKLCTKLLIHHISFHLNPLNIFPDAVADIRDVCLRVTSQSKVNSDLQASIASLSIKARHSAWPVITESRFQRGRIILRVSAAELKRALWRKKMADLHESKASFEGTLHHKHKHGQSTADTALTAWKPQADEQLLNLRTTVTDRVSKRPESWIVDDLLWERQRNAVLHADKTMPPWTRLTHIFLTDTGYLGITTADTKLADAGSSKDESDLRVTFHSELSKHEDTTFFDTHTWPPGYEYGICLDSAAPFQELLSWLQ